jgi:hypothetical protein
MDMTGLAPLAFGGIDLLLTLLRSSTRQRAPDRREASPKRSRNQSLGKADMPKGQASVCIFGCWQATGVDVHADFVRQLAQAVSWRIGRTGADLYRALSPAVAGLLPPRAGGQPDS